MEEVASRRLFEKTNFAAVVGIFFTTASLDDIVASRDEVVAFMVAGKISNLGSQTRTEASNGLQSREEPL
jgi:hypothetical protein